MICFGKSKLCHPYIALKVLEEDGPVPKTLMEIPKICGEEKNSPHSLFFAQYYRRSQNGEPFVMYLFLKCNNKPKFVVSAFDQKDTREMIEKIKQQRNIKARQYRDDTKRGGRKRKSPPVQDVTVAAICQEPVPLPLGIQTDSSPVAESALEHE